MSRFTYSEWQRAEEAASAVAMQAVQKAEEKRRKAREVHEWNARISSLLAVQRALEGRSGTTVAGSTADEKQQQGEVAGDVLQTGPSGEPEFRREPTRRGLLDRLGRSSNGYTAGDTFGGRESDVPVGFGSAENQIYPDNDAVRESNFRSSKGVKIANSRFRW